LKTKIFKTKNLRISINQKTGRNSEALYTPPLVKIDNWSIRIPWSEESCCVVFMILAEQESLLTREPALVYTRSLRAQQSKLLSCLRQFTPQGFLLINFESSWTLLKL